ncbi:MAG: hypothetical protein H6713_27950 [Myxococcales bacterium]|nr:hypothetical protein [Myxococcales bacterium]
MSGSLETSRGSSPAPDRAAVLQYFARDHRPCWFTAESFVHITGLERAIPGLRYLSHTDPTDGACARVTVPRGVVERTRFANSLEVVNYLLGHPEGARAVRAAGPGRALFLFFDERTEAACAELGVELAFPSAALRRALDDKREALRIADAVGLRCAPGVLARVTSYARLRALAADAGLGAELVVQAPFGHSGQTTWFIASARDYERHAAAIAAEPGVRVMRRLDCRSVAVEGCVTRDGVAVGPAMLDLTGVPELTPFRGGWCGNAVGPDVLPRAAQDEVRSGTRRVGEALATRGYRGYFEVDWLVERSTDAVYLGEINPRISGATLLSNLASTATDGVSLLHLHLLEFDRARGELGVDLEAFNRDAGDPARLERWTLLILEHTGATAVRVHDAPDSGVLTLGPGSLARVAGLEADLRRFPGAAKWYRTITPGDQARPGDILGRLVLREPVGDDGALSSRARAWISALRQRHALRPIERARVEPPAAPAPP